MMLGGLLLTAMPLCAQAQDAKAVMEKATNAMKSAKTYQATMVMTMTMGKMGTMSMTMDTKMIPNKKMAMTYSGASGTGQMGQGAAFVKGMRMVDDGKNMFMYMPAMKSYSKRPSTMATMGSQDPVSMLTKMGGSYKMLPASSVNGKPAYAIQVNSPQMNGGKMIVFVDKATNRVSQVKMNMQNPQAGAMLITATVKNDKINEPIADSVFSFTPPPGAKEMEMPAGAGGLGMPGMPGGGK